jgi:2,3-bisphosphoglycerate-independent phosphoglycerate mutase
MNPLVLIILDGFGVREKKEANAVKLAHTPYLDQILRKYPHTTLEASGEAVGLPAGTMGNSEVGHLTIGSGRIIYQDLSRINHAIEDGSFFKNDVLRKAFQTARESNKTVHLLGLLSDGGVHSHERHLFALVKMAKNEKVSQLAVHCFLDGRDTPPASSQTYLRNLQKELGDSGEIATLVGRYFAMDRDKRWDRVQIAYEALVEGKGEPHQEPVVAVEEAYQKHETDEFIKPIVFPPKRLKSNRIQDGDVVIFFNFRADRARELTQALAFTEFSGFSRKKFPKLGMFVCMTQYDKTYDLPVVFPPERPKRILAELLSERGIPQFHTAETEKYAHVTYFLNGGIEKPFPGEERLLVPSPKDVPTYDKKPEMSAYQVTEEALERIRDGCPVVIMNYANPDMVGHSGILDATIQAVEVIDECIGKICKEVLDRKGTVIITADHGNCEEMMDDQGGPHTAHTTNPVPFLLVSDSWKNVKLCSKCGLKDVAPTILNILGIPQPKEMTGESLIIES